jgi:hypothetical protein
MAEEMGSMNQGQDLPEVKRSIYDYEQFSMSVLDADKYSHEVLHGLSFRQSNGCIIMMPRDSLSAYFDAVNRAILSIEEEESSAPAG